MRVLLSTNVYPPKFIGGAELIVHSHAKTLRELGHEPVVFAGDIRGEHERHSEWREDWEGIPVYRVALTSEDFRIASVNFVNRAVEKHFEDVLDELRPDVAHLHNLAGLSARLIHCAKQHGLKTLVTLHDHWGFCYRNTLLKAGGELCADYSQCSECLAFMQDGNKRIPIEMRNEFLAYQLAEADVLISPSEYLARTYVKAGFPVSRMRVIWNGADLDRFGRIEKKREGGRVRFTFIGHFGSHKGISVLLAALPLLGDPARFRLNLVGRGELLEPAREEVNRLGLAGSVRFWGQVPNPDVEQVFADTDVLVLPSLWPENQPVSITEAMAARTPAIASRAGGIPELVEDGRTGYLFRLGDARDLAEKMKMLIDHPERIGPLGEAAFARMEGKHFRDQVKKLLRVYEEPCARGLPPLVESCVER